MPDPAAPSPQPSAPPPAATGFADLFEQSVHALAAAPATFRAAAARPAPSFATACAFALANGAVALGLNLMHALISAPGTLQRFAPPVLAAVGLVVLGLFIVLFLASAAVLLALGRGLGGKGAFDRGLQAAAALTLLLPLQAACSWAPYVWAAPAALGAWIAAAALEGLFGAAVLPARASCALLAAGMIGLQFAGRLLTDRAAQASALAALATVAPGVAPADPVNEQLLRQIQALQAASAGPQDVAGAPQPSGASGLDLLRPPSDGGLAPTAPGPTPALPQGLTPPARYSPPQPTSANLNSANILQSLEPLVSNMAAAPNLSPQQKADIKQMGALLEQTRMEMAAGRPPTPQVQAQRMAQVQQIIMRMMAARTAQGAPSVPQAPPPGGAR